MIVARVKSIKEETHNLMGMRDIEELVINTMGEDIWNAIEYFHEEKIENLKEESIYTKEDVKSYDASLVALRNGVKDELDQIDKLIDKINDSKRLDKRTLVKELNGITSRLYDNEGY